MLIGILPAGCRCFQCIEKVLDTNKGSDLATPYFSGDPRGYLATPPSSFGSDPLAILIFHVLSTYPFRSRKDIVNRETSNFFNEGT